MGIVVNQPAANIKFPDLLVQLEVIPAAERIELPVQAEDVKVLKGGPVETGRGFVLHSADFFIENSTLPIDEGICLTATLDILKAIARGNGPESAILALGYAGWAPGQLEQRNPAERLAALRRRSGIDLRHRYRRQIRKGAAQDRHRPRQLSSEVGPRLARDPEKWGPVFGPDHAQKLACDPERYPIQLFRKSDAAARARPRSVRWSAGRRRLPRSSARRRRSLARIRSRAGRARPRRYRSPRLPPPRPCRDRAPAR